MCVPTLTLFPWILTAVKDKFSVNKEIYIFKWYKDLIIVPTTSMIIWCNRSTRYWTALQVKKHARNKSVDISTPISLTCIWHQWYRARFFYIWENVSGRALLYVVLLIMVHIIDVFIRLLEKRNNDRFFILMICSRSNQHQTYYLKLFIT